MNGAGCGNGVGDVYKCVLCVYGVAAVYGAATSV